MAKFLELIISEEDESKSVLVNVDSIGRAYGNPQHAARSIVELNYQSINDAPVFLEVDIPYDKLRAMLLNVQQ
jgi:hypothetical protein